MLRNGPCWLRENIIIIIIIIIIITGSLVVCYRILSYWYMEWGEGGYKYWVFNVTYRA